MSMCFHDKSMYFHDKNIFKYVLGSAVCAHVSAGVLHALKGQPINLAVPFAAVSSCRTSLAMHDSGLTMWNNYYSFMTLMAFSICYKLLYAAIFHE